MSVALGTSNGDLSGSGTPGNSARHLGSSAVGRTPPGISRAVVERLPKYESALIRFQSRGLAMVTSDQFADEVGISAALVRRDLSQLGQLGTAGHGYDVASVVDALNSILGLGHAWNIAIIGVGLLGRAIAHHIDRDAEAFNLSAAFDVSDAVVGTTIGGVVVQHVREAVKTLEELEIKLAIVTVPPGETQTAVNLLASGGVTAILNYSSLIIEAPDSVEVMDLDPCLSLSMLSYHLTSEAPVG